MQEALENLCRDTFHACRSQTTLDELLAVIGKDKKEKVIQDEIDAIKQEKHFSERSVTFLLEAKQLETAAEYILQRQKKLMELVTTASRR